MTKNKVKNTESGSQKVPETKDFFKKTLIFSEKELVFLENATKKSLKLNKFSPQTAKIFLLKYAEQVLKEEFST